MSELVELVEEAEVDCEETEEDDEDNDDDEDDEEATEDVEADEDDVDCGGFDGVVGAFLLSAQILAVKRVKKSRVLCSETFFIRALSASERQEKVKRSYLHKFHK